MNTLNTEYALFSAAVEKESCPQRNEMDISTKKNENQNDYTDTGVVFTLAKGGKRGLETLVEDKVRFSSDNDDVHNLRLNSEESTKKEEPQSDDSEKGIVFTIAKKGKTRPVDEMYNSKYVQSVDDGTQFSHIRKRYLMSVDSEEKRYNVANDSYDYAALGDKNKLSFEDNNRLKDNRNNVELDVDKVTTDVVDNNGENKHKIAITEKEIFMKNRTHIIENSNNQIIENTTDRVFTNETTKNDLSNDNVMTSLANLNKNTSQEMDLSDFFMMLSNWFSLLAAFDNTPNENTTERKDSE